MLFDGRFGSFIAGRILSSTGIWIHNIAAAIVVFETTQSSLLVALVTVAQFGPQILLTPWSGARADRSDRQQQIVIGRVLNVLASAGLAVVLWTAEIEGTAAGVVVIVASLVAGFGFAVSMPATQAIVPALVHKNELAPAIALMSVPPTVARVVGPAIGAIVVTTMGPALAFGIAALGHFFFVVVLMLMRVPRPRMVKNGDTTIRGALRYLRTNRPIAALLVGVTAVGVAADPVITLTPAVVASLGGDADLVGNLASAFGLGAGAAFAFLTFAQRRFGLPNLSCFGLLVLGSSMTCLAFAPNLPLVVACYVAGGVGMILAVTSQTTLVQQYVSESFRGRIMALWSVAFLGSRPIAAAINGAVADSTSVSVALVIVGLGAAAGAYATRPSQISEPV